MGARYHGVIRPLVSVVHFLSSYKRGMRDEQSKPQLWFVVLWHSTHGVFWYSPWEHCRSNLGIRRLCHGHFGKRCLLCRAADQETNRRSGKESDRARNRAQTPSLDVSLASVARAPSDGTRAIAMAGLAPKPCVSLP